MFHAKDGLYFRLGPFGEVDVIVKVDDSENAQVQRTIQLSPAIWAAVIEAVEPEVEEEVAPVSKPSKKKMHIDEA